MPTLPTSHTLSLAKARKHKLPTVTYPRLIGRALQARNERIKVRDQYTCQCGCGVVSTELEIDHRIPLHLGGTDTDDNLQSMLIECHKAKTAREAVDRADGTSQSVPHTERPTRAYVLA